MTNQRLFLPYNCLNGGHVCGSITELMLNVLVCM